MVEKKNSADDDPPSFLQGLNRSEQRIFARLAALTSTILGIAGLFSWFGLSSFVELKILETIKERLQYANDRIEAQIDEARQKLVSLGDAQRKLNAELKAAEALREETEQALRASDKTRQESASMLESLSQQRTQLGSAATEVSELVGQTSVVLALKKLRYDLYRIKTLRVVTRIDSPLSLDMESGAFIFYISLRDEGEKNVAQFQPLPGPPVREEFTGRVPSMRFEHKLFPVFEDRLNGAPISSLGKVRTITLEGEWFEAPQPGPPVALPRREAATKFWRSIRHIDVRSW